MNAPVDVINYKNGVLYMEEMPLHPLTSKVGTPFYCYSTAALRNAYLQYSRAFADRQALICFAVKANCNPSLLRLFGQLGAGADVVSIGELRFAMKAGIPANKIVFSGVGKTKTELTEALKAGVLQINVESESELKLLDSIAQSLSLVATVAIRVNPDVDAGTHKKITTGKYNTKFGVACEDALDMFMLAGNLPGVAARGLAVHIGSQLTSLEPFEAAFTKLAELVVELRTMGQTITRLDLGGGLGVKYHNENIPAMSAYAAMVKKITDPLKVQLIFEPGRSLVASGGVLVTEVIHTKQNPERRFAIVDAGMNDFKRTALYDAIHRIVPLVEPKLSNKYSYDVVGPVCESTDTFATDVLLPELKSGDRLALLDAGAYGAVLSSHYNVRLTAPEILVDGAKFAVIRKRDTYDELLAAYRQPNWLGL